MEPVTITAEAITEGYEWIQYNEHLRIIHSISDDMFQMQSIITAFISNKLCKDWFRNQSVKELLEHISGSRRIPPDRKPYENRVNLPNELKGIYIHKYLVNHVAIWASPVYSFYIMKLLDDMFQKQRELLKNTIIEQKPRMVPENTKSDYKYLIWKESDGDQKVKLHLVKRHKDSFRQIKDRLLYKWFFRDNLPISMSPNREIKKLIKNNFGENDVNINGSTISCNVNCLDRLHELIENYFNEFQE